jgi:hypothetical protein
MRVKLEPETAFIGKKFAYIFLGIIFSLNALTFIWFFFIFKFKIKKSKFSSKKFKENGLKNSYYGTKKFQE